MTDLARTDHRVAPTPDATSLLTRSARVVLGLLRITLGWIMLWAGLDKIFGFGMNTPSERAVLNGASATAGYLGKLDGPAAAVMAPLAGHIVVDTLFVAGMVLSGIALILGVTTRIAGVSAMIIFAMLWFSMLPLTNNPVVDAHLVYVLLGALAITAGSGRFLGLGRTWAGLPLVRSQAWLQ